MAIRCPKCHSENLDTSRFCGSCAAPIGAEEHGSASFIKTLETPFKGLLKQNG